jgi:3-isopropylmalate/(R)-2-methylmalate dehydratase small subunit
MSAASQDGRYGRAFVYGDNISTDALAVGIYMTQPIAVLARHCLESVDPEFSRVVRPGDVVVGGKGFGIGSSREQAAEALKHLGVAAVLARSYGGIFYRNALNLGLPVLVCAEVEKIATGNMVHVDPATGVIHNQTRGITLTANPLPPFLLAMIADGGLVPHLEKRFAAQRAAATAKGG